jgi:hypothetical protein
MHAGARAFSQRAVKKYGMSLHWKICLRFMDATFVKMTRSMYDSCLGISHQLLPGKGLGFLGWREMFRSMSVSFI